MQANGANLNFDRFGRSKSENIQHALSHLQIGMDIVWRPDALDALELYL